MKRRPWSVTERGKKREITFNTKTYRLATMEPSPWLDQFGFPDHQSFPMNGQEALVRVNALIDFILPPLLKEIQNYGQAALPNPLSMTRRIG